MCQTITDTGRIWFLEGGGLVVFFDNVKVVPVPAPHAHYSQVFRHNTETIMTRIKGPVFKQMSYELNL